MNLYQHADFLLREAVILLTAFLLFLSHDPFLLPQGKDISTAVIKSTERTGEHFFNIFPQMQLLAVSTSFVGPVRASRPASL